MTGVALPAETLQPPLSEAEFARFTRLAARLPRPWILSPRRRRLLFLGLAAPGFAGVFATPLHQNLAVLAMGFLLFAAACAFRARTEPLFARAEAAALWPPNLPPDRSETPHV